MKLSTINKYLNKIGLVLVVTINDKSITPIELEIITCRKYLKRNFNQQVSFE